MAARRLPALLPLLDREEALAVTRIHSIAGILPADSGLVTRPPFRMPHHTASCEGILGGGRLLRPGGGFPRPPGGAFPGRGAGVRDEPPAGAAGARGGRMGFHRARGMHRALPRHACSSCLPSIPVPAETSAVAATSASAASRRSTATGAGSAARSWTGSTSAFPFRPYLPRTCARRPSRRKTLKASERVRAAVARQRVRYAGLGFNWNSRIPPACMDRFCGLDARGRGALLHAAEALGISSRAFHSILRTARTIADLAGDERIGETHILEAVQHRRYGDGDFFWAHSGSRIVLVVRRKRPARRLSIDGASALLLLFIAEVFT